MNIGISDIGLSSSIYNSIDIDSDQDGDTFKLEVQINQKTIYTTQLSCPIDSYAYLYDLGVLVNEYMRDHSLTLAKLDVLAFFDNHFDEASIWVLYSEMKVSYEVDLEFIQNHFLTTRSFYNIPRGHYLPLNFVIYKQTEQPVGYINACFQLNDGSVHTHRYQVSLTDRKDTNLYHISLSDSSIRFKLIELYPNDNPKVLSGSLVMGARKMDFYFIDENPVEEFDFINGFNCLEHFLVYGTQTIKTEFKQKVALVSGVTKHYAQSSERKVEIETVPLTLEEADWLNQFFGSQFISKRIPPDDDQQVLVSDIDSVISDSAKDMVRLKFSWCFSQPFKWKIFDSFQHRFNDKFSEPFG